MPVSVGFDVGGLRLFLRTRGRYVKTPFMSPQSVFRVWWMVGCVLVGRSGLRKWNSGYQRIAEWLGYFGVPSKTC